MSTILAALLTETTNPSPYLQSAEWCAEEKLNGRRMILTKRGDVVRAYSRNGREYVAPLAVVKRMQLSGTDLVLDGELVGETFIPFDVLWIGGACFAHVPFHDRRKALVIYSPFRCVDSIRTDVMKQLLFRAVKDQGGEGLVFKRLDGAYQLGQRTYGVKFKFYQTMTVRVRGINMQKCTVEVRCEDGGSLASANVSFPFNKTWPKVGELWEVRYDEISANGELMRPRLLQRRDDLE